MPRKELATPNRLTLLLGFLLTILLLSASAFAQTFTIVASFSGTIYDPLAPLVQARDGSLVGTTELGGKNHDGTLFDVTLGGTIDFLHSFSNAGSYPPDPEGLTLGLNGNFYGTTYHDGTSFVGTIYELSAAGDYQVLHEFAGTDGANPDGALVLGLDGNFYGTTYMGGANNTGT